MTGITPESPEPPPSDESAQPPEKTRPPLEHWATRRERYLALVLDQMTRKQTEGDRASLKAALGLTSAERSRPTSLTVSKILLHMSSYLCYAGLLTAPFMIKPIALPVSLAFFVGAGLAMTSGILVGKIAKVETETEGKRRLHTAELLGWGTPKFSRALYSEYLRTPFVFAVGLIAILPDLIASVPGRIKGILQPSQDEETQ